MRPNLLFDGTKENKDKKTFKETLTIVADGTSEKRIERQPKVTDNIKTNPIKKSIDWYFRPKSFERSGKFYEVLGIRLFYSFYMKTFGKLVAFLQRITKGSGKWLDNGSNESLKSQAESTSRIEALHIFGFIAFSYLIYGFIVIVPSSFWLTCMIVAQVFANIYPIMLQRYIRTRIYNILEHRELKRTSKIISQSDIPQNELTIDRGEIRSVIGEVLTSFPKTVPLAIRQSL